MSLRLRVVAALAVLGTLGLACSGWRGPPRVLSLSAAPGACGAWTADVAVADLRGHDVALRVGGAEVERWPGVWGDRRWTVAGQGRPFERATFEVEVLGTPSRRTREVALSGGRVDVRLQPERLVLVPGEPAVLDLVVRGDPCPVDGMRWRASTGAWSDGGVVGGDRATVHVPAHHPGAHTVSVEVWDDHLRETAQATLVVGEPSRVDGDGDGYPGGVDCDDADPATHPGALERPDPNGRDDDCDGIVDEGTAVYDDDGDGRSEVQGDCHDGDAATHPGAPEVANCRDDDCDGEVDDGAAFRPWPDDAFETPGDGAYRLTDRSRRLEVPLPLVSRDLQDRERIEFWSQDGDWDQWGIDVVAARLPADSAFRVQIRRFDGAVVGAGTLARDGDAVRAEGRAFRDDSGVYEVVIHPLRLYADGCPVELRLESR